ncbi:uncharacterized protein Eint_050900 [Encephalitozoon intestinalis ATCC 50506]|uniref:Uncharacterized protein n=1 Tax=Encephalitozoon intestinalis (strain ATCC 50506) TaxID=876142 RepID=E0S7B0_ENCIT|nr:uncharacterized protein Eint_050900 [Encephalitozoon intestinalis ATCC 50506]ADM11538.1 hypothetical protein Eint_050900 [Encephalitozoon intestinalis ATCC 50506]UTX45252.1 hypothetical protein GPK93_05g07970 [Encephalitozoon intestinalis]
MLEDLDGFIFRRNGRQGTKGRRLFSEGKGELEVARGNTDGIFSFKFVREKKRKVDLEVESLGKKSKGKDVVWTEEKGKEGMEVCEEGDICSSIVIREVPKKRMSVSSLHEKLEEGGTLGGLVRLCVEYVLEKKKTGYGMDLGRKLHQNEDLIKKRDVEKEVEEAEKKIEWASCEEEKWNSLRNEVENSNLIEIREPKKRVRDFGYEEKMEGVRREFSAKIERLEFLKESALACVSRIREQSEDLLGRILRIMCKEKEVDTLFLLKTLSRTSK